MKRPIFGLFWHHFAVHLQANNADGTDKEIEHSFFLAIWVRFLFFALNIHSCVGSSLYIHFVCCFFSPKLLELNTPTLFTYMFLPFNDS